MNIIIHRGTHQIGGSAIEISTASTRIILDFGNELSLDEKYTPINLDIEGVTKGLPIVTVLWISSLSYGSLRDN